MGVRRQVTYALTLHFDMALLRDDKPKESVTSKSLSQKSGSKALRIGG